MQKKGHTVRWGKEVEEAIEKAIKENRFKNMTEAVTTILKKYFKIKP